MRHLHLGRAIPDPGQEHWARLFSAGAKCRRHTIVGGLPRQAHPGTNRENTVLQAQVSHYRPLPEETRRAMSSPKEVKDDRKYTKDHEWARTEGGELVV